MNASPCVAPAAGSVPAAELPLAARHALDDPAYAVPDHHLSKDQLVRTVRELPALSAVVLELIELLGQDDVDAERLSAKINLDQALTAKTLRLANSSFYGLPRKVSHVSDALAVLGLRSVRTVITTAAVTGGFTPPPCRGFDFNGFWTHAIGTAVCAGLLARATRRDADSAFTAGLLHDLGRLVLASCFPQRFEAVWAYQQQHDAPPTLAERHLLGLDHAEMGGLMAEHWHFSTTVVAAIRRHHLPEVDKGGSGLAGLVHVADNIVHALDLAPVDGDAVPPLDPAAWLSLNLDGATLRQVFEQTEVQTRAVCDVLL